MDALKSTSNGIANAVNMDNNILNCLKFLRDEVIELYLPKQVHEVAEIPEPLEFYQNWVAPNIPVLIKGGINNWPALKKWKKEYFGAKLKDKLISVSVTPNGYADAIKETEINGETKEIFVLPEERLMTILDFYEKLEAEAENRDEDRGVFYIQKQNSNLTEEFPELLSDIDAELLWATETFKTKPAAINLWIGGEKAVTSLHKDPFENIYCVVSGYKEFILLPPTDRPWLPYKVLPVGQYREKDPGSFEVIPYESVEWVFKDTSDLSQDKSLSTVTSEGPYEVPWVAIDPHRPDYEKYPLYANTSPITVRVNEGDALYLPSLWYHYVRQSNKCIAVNYWYDMNLDIKFAYFQLLEKLSTYLNN